MDYTEKVLKLLVDKFDWNLNTSLTSTGKKLVSDTIKALDIIKENESKLHQPTVISTVCCCTINDNDRKNFERNLNKCRVCEKQIKQTDL